MLIQNFGMATKAATKAATKDYSRLEQHYTKEFKIATHSTVFTNRDGKYAWKKELVPSPTTATVAVVVPKNHITSRLPTNKKFSPVKN